MFNWDFFYEHLKFRFCAMFNWDFFCEHLKFSSHVLIVNIWRVHQGWRSSVADISNFHAKCSTGASVPLWTSESFHALQCSVETSTVNGWNFHEQCSIGTSSVWASESIHAQCSVGTSVNIWKYSWPVFSWDFFREQLEFSCTVFNWDFFCKHMNVFTDVQCSIWTSSLNIWSFHVGTYPVMVLIYLT